ncbi:MAG TPA: hypothetical protein QGI59_02785 [Candidatus Poseidoniia archaeon]|nr:hypothetical protein [Candidatus Poseidoniia archaeon]
MSYDEVLKLLETALGDADSLEREFDRSKTAMEGFESTRKEARGAGLSFSDASYDEAKSKFDSGDYKGATEIASDYNNKLESCHSGFESLNNLFEMLETFEMKHTDDFDSLKKQIDKSMEDNDFDSAKSLCDEHESTIRSQLSDYEKAKNLVSKFTDKIEGAKPHILIEAFVPDEELAEQHLSKRELAETISISEKGIRKIQNALDNWRPEIKVTLPEDLVSSESNRAIILVENTGKANAQKVVLTLDGIDVRGNLSTGEINPGNSEEIVVGLTPSTPGNIPIKVSKNISRTFDGSQTSIDEQIWVEILRAGGTSSSSPKRKAEKEDVVEEEAIEVEPEWSVPEDLDEDQLIVGEFFSKRWESYMAYPDNKTILDHLHNNRDKYAISSYFEVPTDPQSIMEEWALPHNLRGNIHLDSKRKEIVRDIFESPYDDNYVIIGEPGVGKTVLLFEVFDRLMKREPAGILTNENIGNAHETFKIRLFYDDISEKPDLYNAIAAKESISGLILSSREAEWSELPVDFRKKFTRLTVPRFSDDEMKQLVLKTLEINAINKDANAVKTLVSYAQGSPIYVGSLIKEMVYSNIRRLSQTYLKENAQKGMAGYVTMILQRLLKTGNDYRTGGLHALSCLMFLANHVEERKCHEQLLRAFADEIDEHMEDKFDDVYDRRTFNRSIDYLSGQGSLVRFPHDTWVDILQGQGATNPFRPDIQEIRKEFEDTGMFEKLKKDAIDDAWEAIKKRYLRNNVREKDSFLELCDTLTTNFRLSDLKEMKVDIAMVREVSSKHRDEPVAAAILSRLEGAEPTHNVINIQDSVISKSNIGTDGSAEIKESVVHKSKTGK